MFVHLKIFSHKYLTQRYIVGSTITIADQSVFTKVISWLLLVINRIIKKVLSTMIEVGCQSKKIHMDLFSFNKSVALYLQRYRQHAENLKARLLPLLCSDILNVQTFRLTSMIDTIQSFISL